MQNKKFNSVLCELQELEQDRIYCKHDLSHLIEVARIMLLLNDNLLDKIDRDLIVATALMHDLGRVNQYKYNIDHREYNFKIVKDILTECTYSMDEINEIISAIKAHKNDSTNTLSSLLYKADKLSRPCYTCKVKSTCYWDEKLKNKEYYYANRK